MHTELQRSVFAVFLPFSACKILSGYEIGYVRQTSEMHFLEIRKRVFWRPQERAVNYITALEKLGVIWYNSFVIGVGCVIVHTPWYNNLYG